MCRSVRWQGIKQYQCGKIEHTPTTAVRTYVDYSDFQALLDAVDARNGCHRQPLTRGEDGVSARGSAIGSSGKSAQGGDDKMEVLKA